jgi:lysophospholipase L1-like esterase
MKRILCFGDSNTWGYDPLTGKRFDKEVRWTGVLSSVLGNSYEVIEEGLNGRTTVWDDPIEGYKNGRDYFVPCLQSHHPLDLVIIMLGTNDLKSRFSLSAMDIALGAGVLVDIVQKSDASAGDPIPKVLLIAPPPIAKLGVFAEVFEGAGAKSRKFSECFKNVATTLGCAFLDAGTIVTSSEVDGIHLDREEHIKLGQAMALKVKELIG